MWIENLPFISCAWWVAVLFLSSNKLLDTNRKKSSCVLTTSSPGETQRLFGGSGGKGCVSKGRQSPAAGIVHRGLEQLEVGTFAKGQAGQQTDTVVSGHLHPPCHLAYVRDLRE